MITTSLYRTKAALNHGENPLPQFRNPEHDLMVEVRQPYPEKYEQNLGKNCGKRVLPYYLQDRYDRKREETEIPSIILENNELKATFLPTLGGRLISLYDKTENQELLFNTSTLQVGNLANRDSWFAGGIEWNFGQYGHAFSTCSDIYASMQKDSKGEEFLRLYEYERCIGIHFQADFHLDGALLFAHMTIYNLSENDTSLYYWSNTALRQTEKTRVFASTSEVIYIDPTVEPGKRRYGFGKLPYLEILPDVDVSYPNNFPYSNEYFFMCNQTSLPWEATLYEDGNSFFDASTPNLPYRKMFCWGNGWGGKHWQQHLSPEGGEYFEAQAGLSPTQLHGSYINAQSSIHWTQLFGSLGNIDSLQADAAWDQVQEKLQVRINDLISPASMEEKDKLYEQESFQTTGKILHQGSGWGYLEMLRSKIQIPASLQYLPDEELHGWEVFLESRILPERAKTEPPLQCPPLWWYPLLRQSESAWYHAGILALELDEPEEAKQCWEGKEDGFALRNLAQLAKRNGNEQQALAYYKRASLTAEYHIDRALAEEYLHALVLGNNVSEALKVYEELPFPWKEESDSIALDRAFIACNQEDAETLERLLQRDWAFIREGETPLDFLWYEWQTILYARRTQQRVTPLLRNKIHEELNVPQCFDFSMVH